MQWRVCRWAHFVALTQVLTRDTIEKTIRSKGRSDLAAQSTEQQIANEPKLTMNTKRRTMSWTWPR